MYDYQEQFYQVMTRIRGFRAASTPTQENATVTEVMNGLIVTRPVKKEPEIIDLQEYARSRKGNAAASVPDGGINKVRDIAEFMFSNSRRV